MPAARRARCQHDRAVDRPPDAGGRVDGHLRPFQRRRQEPAAGARSHFHAATGPERHRARDAGDAAGDRLHPGVLADPRRHAPTCGPPVADTSVPRRVRYECSSGSCKRWEGPVGGALDTGPETVIWGLQNADVFFFSPDSVNPTFVSMKVEVSVNGADEPDRPRRRIRASQPGGPVVRMRSERGLHARRDPGRDGADVRRRRRNPPGVRHVGPHRSGCPARHVATQKAQAAIDLLGTTPYNQLGLTADAGLLDRPAEPGIPRERRLAGGESRASPRASCWLRIRNRRAPPSARQPSPSPSAAAALRSAAASTGTSPGATRTARSDVCDGTQNTKRLTVAVTVDANGDGARGRADLGVQGDTRPAGPAAGSHRDHRAHRLDDQRPGLLPVRHALRQHDPAACHRGPRDPQHRADQRGREQTHPSARTRRATCSPT